MALLSTQESQKHNGEFDSCMSFLTASLINPMSNSALFDHGVHSSRALRVVPMSLPNFFTSEDIVHQTCQPQKSQVHQSPWQIA